VVVGVVAGDVVQLRPLGKEVPRIWTRPLRKLTPRTSLGYKFIEFCRDDLGWEMLPWQKWWSIHALELLPRSRKLRFRVLLTLVGRQCGKTTLVMALALYFMKTKRNPGARPHVLGAAQTIDISREAWAAAVATAETHLPSDLNRFSVRLANGQESLTLRNGARYRIVAANRRSARGLAVGLLLWDEIREQRDFDGWAALSKTTSAQPQGLIVAISNAGDDTSVVLNQVRESAISATVDTIGIFEWSAPDDCDIDDWEAIAQGSPALGYTLSYDAVLASLETDPPGVFRTEVMCQHVESLDSPVSPPAWQACADPTGSHVLEARHKWFCLDVAPDGQHATLAAATLGDDGRVRVGVVSAWTDTSQLRLELPGLLAEYKPAKLGWFPNGPAAALMADLVVVRRSTEFKPQEAPAACQGFAEQVHARRLIHGNDALLTAHVLGSRRLPVGDGWRFMRRGGNADAAYAAAGAVHLARMTKPPPRLRLVI